MESCVQGAAQSICGAGRYGRAVARAAKATTRTKQKTPFTILLLNCFLLRGDLLLAATELGLSGYCEQAPFKPNVPDSRGVKRSAQWLVAVKRGISLPPSARTRPGFWFQPLTMQCIAFPPGAWQRQRGVSLHQLPTESVLCYPLPTINSTPASKVYFFSD